MFFYPDQCMSSVILEHRLYKISLDRLVSDIFTIFENVYVIMCCENAFRFDFVTEKLCQFWESNS
jgi:hypothetical protein